MTAEHREDGLAWVTCWKGHHVHLTACASQADLDEPIRWLKAAITPAPRDVLIKALGEVGICCAMNSLQSESVKGTLAIFAARLGDLPGDAVIDALRAWPNDNRWFPSLNDIISTAAARHWRGGVLSRLINIREARTPALTAPKEADDT